VRRLPTEPASSLVEVAILGPVELRGAARPFRRAWSLELVAYLAVHPDGASSDRWATALWPDRVMADPTRHSIASAARRALGRAPGGEDHLPRRHGGLRLAPTVRTDWARLRSLAASEEPAAWAAAMTLVRGRPFDGLRAPDWAVLEGTLASVEDDVTALALRLAEHRLASGDSRGATDAARRGLRASPYDERLYRVLLRAADAQGNPAGVEAVMAELLGLIDGPAPAGWSQRDSTYPAGAARGPFGGGSRHPRHGAGGLMAEALAALHPQTVALYQDLSRRPALPPVPGGSLARL
jgi:DNA-binding SARP family transcriptional activator